MLCYRHRMTWEGDGHSDPRTHGVARPTHHHKGRLSLVGFKVQSDANTEMKSRVSCFSSLLNFNNIESTHIN